MSAPLIVLAAIAVASISQRDPNAAERKSNLHGPVARKARDRRSIGVRNCRELDARNIAPANDGLGGQT